VGRNVNSEHSAITVDAIMEPMDAKKSAISHTRPPPVVDTSHPSLEMSLDSIPGSYPAAGLCL